MMNEFKIPARNEDKATQIEKNHQDETGCLKVYLNRIEQYEVSTSLVTNLKQ
jgi:hypothetical protein